MKSNFTKAGWVGLALVTESTAYVAATGEPVIPGHETAGSRESPPRPAAFKPPQLEPAPIPQGETTPASANAGFATPSAFNAVPITAAAASQTLSGPVTLTYNGTSNAFSLTQAGAGRGLSASVTNAKNTMSTLYGDTTGSGAGVMGSNPGTLGPGGKFQVTNANSAQAGAFATTSGTGPGMLGTITNKTSKYPAVLGQSTTSTNGIGVEGKGNYYGVYGLVPSSSKNTFTAGVLGETDATGGTNPNYAVYGYSAEGDGIGVGATADSGYGMYAYSSSNYGIYAYSAQTSAIYAETGVENSDRVSAIYGATKSGIGVQGAASNGTGVYGDATNGNGVLGEDTGKGRGVWGLSNTGVGVYGSSMSGTAGFFAGNVTVTETITVGSLAYSSDKNVKTAVRPIDTKDLLKRVTELPISSWQYKQDPLKRHVGPMAQDFHAAFGLNGDDETHISAVDIAGVSLAAVKELGNQMKMKDAQIAELRARNDVQAAQISELTAKFATLNATLVELSAERLTVNR